MSPNTVADGLLRYEIGRKVRALRLRKKISLVELGRHTGFSPALLSKIESSKIFPPLGTLLRIAMVFGVGLDHFFSDAREKPVAGVVRKASRIRLPSDPSRRTPAYSFESLDFPVNDRRSSAYLAEFYASDPQDAPAHDHGGFETIYVIRGKLAVTLGGEEHILGNGDSMYFDASVPHSYRRAGSGRCQAVVFVVS